MTIDEKKILTDETILMLEELKTLYVEELNDDVTTLKKKIKNNIKTLLNKSELLFSTKSEKYFYDLYMHFGLFTLISRKEIIKYLTETFGLTTGSIKPSIHTLEHTSIKNTWYVNWMQEDAYYANGLRYPKEKFANLRTRFIKGDKSDQFILMETAVLKLVKNKNIEVRDEDVARFAKMLLQQGRK